VTSKEPTLANKKKQRVKTQQESPEEAVTGETPADETVLESTDTDLDEPVENDAVPERPTEQEILSRLLEKDETILKLTKDNADKDRHFKELNDKWLRMAAEFENYRKRTRKEWELLKQQSKAEVVLEILEIVDDFERAFSVAEDADPDEFLKGIRLIYNNLTGALTKFGVSEIEALNSSFDPNFHMAIGQIETGDVSSGFVAEVVQKGYTLDDTVIRPARVIVAK
jgi:molecular chaperone GrpE